MVVEEEVQETRTVKVLRCDKCCRSMRDKYDREHMSVITLNGLELGADGKKAVVRRGLYHLCCECAFSLEYEFDENRKHSKERGKEADRRADVAMTFDTPWQEEKGRRPAREQRYVTGEEQATLLSGLYPRRKRRLSVRGKI